MSQSSQEATESVFSKSYFLQTVVWEFSEILRIDF